MNHIEFVSLAKAIKCPHISSGYQESTTPPFDPVVWELEISLEQYWYTYSVFIEDILLESSGW